MKRLLYNIIGCLLLGLLGACNEENLTETPDVQQGRIVLDFSSGLNISRATVPDEATKHEYDLAHFDVMIFDSDAQGKLVYHERFVNPGAAADDGTGSVTLGISADKFTSESTYWVYVVANSSKLETEFSTLVNLDGLKDLTQTDANLHLTGSGLEHVPITFLMDGIAFVGESTATEPANKTAIKLYDSSNQQQTLNLKVVLRRAAAKIVVKLSSAPADGEVVFDKNLSATSPGYYLRNLLIATKLLADVDQVTATNQTLAKTTESPSPYYVWNEDGSITLTAYVYSHSWKSADNFNYGTNIVVNIPMKFDGKDYPNNYYQIPLGIFTDNTTAWTFQRNHYYEYTVSINAPGASSVHEPVTVSPLEFSTLDWTEKTISVGGVDGPTYLKVNREEMDMYYIDEDATTLRFASSSPVTVTVESAYYIDKFGQQQTINDTSDISGEVVADALSGNITVKSPLPTNNTIRYFRLKVTNGTQTEYVDVKQYPLIYVTNIQGWYSYRDDFKKDNAYPTTYKYKGDSYVNVSLEIENRKWTGGYVYSTNYRVGFWRSKVAGNVITQEDADNSWQYGNNDVGKANLSYYYWSNNNVQEAEYGLQNTRMYHVRVTSTSPTYIVGNPRLVDEVTERTEANAQLVAPSFMIASRLGFINSGGGDIDYAKSVDDLLKLYEDHCKNYVEVYKDGNGKPIEFHDWRLPTKAEIDIIIGLQGYSNQQADAIDYLLNADFYMSATGPVFNTKNQDGDSKYDYTEKYYNEVAGRCVRTALANSVSTTNE